jgi:hypothetical protein
MRISTCTKALNSSGTVPAIMNQMIMDGVSATLRVALARQAGKTDLRKLSLQVTLSAFLLARSVLVNER